MRVHLHQADQLAAARRYLRAHPVTADFTRRFNLPIYDQLRVQEVNRLLDAALSSPLYRSVLVPQARATMVETARKNDIDWPGALAPKVCL